MNWACQSLHLSCKKVKSLERLNPENFTVCESVNCNQE